MTNLETFEYNPEMETYETGQFEWGAKPSGLASPRFSAKRKSWS